MTDQAAVTGTGGRLVTLGETIALLTPVEAGPLHHTRLMRLGIGGSETNVAIGVRRLGAQAAWIGRVGQDEFGDLIVRELRAETVEAHVIRDAAPTGFMIKTRRTPDHVRVLYYRKGSAGSRLVPDDIDGSVIPSADILHITGITPALGPGPAAAVRAAVELAAAAGVLVSFDVNFRASLWDSAQAARELRDLVQRADLVFAGEQEAWLFVDQAPARQTAVAMSRLGPSQVIIKYGRAGVVGLIDGDIYTAPAHVVSTVDPVGAGDAFVAGYLAELLAGAGPEQRLATATASGALAVTSAGDWEGLPTREDLNLLASSDSVAR
ncbi:sugar kinase [Micromonospora globbae]|uniref:sugar kinase n=1 Tax=Micromonospora globbae TaxID=1894969 RepID=UPI003428E0D1